MTSSIFRACSSEDVGNYFSSRERREGERPDEFLRASGHDDLHLRVTLHERAGQLGGLIRGDTAANS